MQLTVNGPFENRRQKEEANGFQWKKINAANELSTIHLVDCSHFDHGMQSGSAI